jgi:hypothetical protein
VELRSAGEWDAAGESRQGYFNLRVRTFSWSDPAIGMDVARSLSGIDFLPKITRGQIPAPPIFGLIDFRLVKVEPAR